MFRREIKKQFNENKYNILTRKGVRQTSHLTRVPFQKQVIGSLALMVLGFNYTKRYFTFPHHHHDPNEPVLLANGELAPFENQPAGATDKYKPYVLHKAA
eukprot:403368388